MIDESVLVLELVIFMANISVNRISVILHISAPLDLRFSLVAYKHSMLPTGKPTVKQA